MQPEVEVKVKEQPIPAHTIKIAGESQGLEWYVPSEERGTLFNTLEEAKKAGVWNYPATLMQTAKCAVFEDLWSKGNYMGGGLKFGGDLLVYPGEFCLDISQTLLIYCRRSTSFPLALFYYCTRQSAGGYTTS